MSDQTTVFVVEDDSIIRCTILSLADSIGLRARGYAKAGDFLGAYSPDNRGCLVLDLRLPDMSGLQLIEQLVNRFRYLPTTVIITGHGDIQTAVAAIRSGVLDFLEKPFRPQQLLDQIQNAIRVEANAYREFTRRMNLEAAAGQLSIREKQVLSMLLANKSNKQIAAELQLSFKTISWHRTSALRKLEVESMLDLAGHDYAQLLS